MVMGSHFVSLRLVRGLSTNQIAATITPFFPRKSSFTGCNKTESGPNYDDVVIQK